MVLKNLRKLLKTLKEGRWVQYDQEVMQADEKFGPIFQGTLKHH